MHKIIDNFKNIQNQINSKISELKINNYIPNIVAVSKTFNITHINPLVDYGHEHF
jgi:Predicted enzyme with a TIM-barrel fold